MFGEKSKGIKLNRFAYLVFAFVLVLNIAILLLWKNFQDNFVKYQEDETKEIKENISKYLKDEQTLSENFADMDEEYNFEILVIGSNGVVYTSTGMNTIDEVEEAYDNHFLYKELYEENGYQVWFSVNGVDFPYYINVYLLINVILISLIVIGLIVFLYVFSRRIISSLIGVYKLIKELKDNNSIGAETTHTDDALENVNSELLLLIGQLSLNYYDAKTVESENNKVITYQKSLLGEQKQYLETAIHDVKTPISSVAYSLYNLKKKYDISDEMADEIDQLYKQTHNAMLMVMDSLETVRDDSLDIFIDEDNIVINEIVESNFKTNEFLLSKRNISYEITGSECIIYTNRLKVIQMLNNITSNMIMYSKDDSKMSIEFEETKVKFINEIGNKENEYTTKKGKKFISNIANELDFIVEETVEDNVYVVTIDFGEHNTLC